MNNKLLFLTLSCVAIAGCGTISRAPAPSAPPAKSSAKEIRPLEPQRAEALLVALMALGVDYRYGGRTTATGFDCSGLVAHVFEEAYGIRLPRTSLGQSEVGRAVALQDLEPGDLVFYDTLGRPYSHVGIYIGEGKFVHAPKTGQAVRVESLKTSYWTKRFNGARRIPASL